MNKILKKENNKNFHIDSRFGQQAIYSGKFFVGSLLIYVVSKDLSSTAQINHKVEMLLQAILWMHLIELLWNDVLKAGAASQREMQMNKLGNFLLQTVFFSFWRGKLTSQLTKFEIKILC